MIAKKISWVVTGLLLLQTAYAQKSLVTGAWFGNLLREDGKQIRFHFDLKTENQKTVMYIINAAEKIRVDKIRYSADSVWIDMPVFESYFRAKRVSDQRWEGSWTSAGSAQWSVMSFIAETQATVNAPALLPAVTDLTGKWAVTFTRPNGTTRPAIGDWQQKGNVLRGTILAPSGDYRYLTGHVSGDELQLSTFDGSHAFLFTAKINGANQVSEGMFYSGATGKEPWMAVRNAAATLPDAAAVFLKAGEDRLNFRFRDLDQKWVSIKDPRFQNKVVIVQIMGSWCPNCMDETAFLSEYYRKNKQRGVEVIGLAYEYSTDPERSRNSLRKFKDRFQVQYPLLITGVTVSDTLRTEKTLPQLTPIKAFPTTIFIGKDGKVAKIKAGFKGPGAGAYHEELKKEFAETIDALLKGQK
jgi:thiol-disulfide isomerase/thioredoxin